MFAEDRSENEIIKQEEVLEKSPKGFAVWSIDGDNYKLKLSTAGVKELEKMYKTNLINIMGDSEGGMPSLTTMLQVTHTAMKNWNHGIKMSRVEELFDIYLENGGSQLDFYTEVYMSIFTASGFFSESLAREMANTLEKTKESM